MSATSHVAAAKANVTRPVYQKTVWIMDVSSHDREPCYTRRQSEGSRSSRPGFLRLTRINAPARSPVRAGLGRCPANAEDAFNNVSSADAYDVTGRLVRVFVDPVWLATNANDLLEVVGRYLGQVAAP